MAIEKGSWPVVLAWTKESEADITLSRVVLWGDTCIIKQTVCEGAVANQCMSSMFVLLNRTGKAVRDEPREYILTGYYPQCCWRRVLTIVARCVSVS